MSDLAKHFRLEELREFEASLEEELGPEVASEFRRSFDWETGAIGIEPSEELDADEEMHAMPLWLDMLLTVFVTVVVMMFVRAFLIDTYVVPTGSMLDTIQLGDRLVGEKVSYYFRDPLPGEVVTFDDPDDEGVILIKRVIATAGQEVDLIDGVVYVDGEALEEPYVQGKPTQPIDAYASSLEAPLTYPLVVPDDCVWVMGDNRTNSLDSRYFGPVSTDAVLARALFIFWPSSDAGRL